MEARKTETTSGFRIDGPEFFHCERFRTTMLKRRCVERQAGRWNSASPMITKSMSFLDCINCKQGRQIADEIGEIVIEPARFERLWLQEKGGKMEESISEKQCRQCLKTRPLSEFRADKRTEDRLKNICNRCLEGSPGEEVEEEKADEKRPAGPDTPPIDKRKNLQWLDIGLQKYPNIFPALKKIANEEFRTVKLQVLKFIQEGLDRDA